MSSYKEKNRQLINGPKVIHIKESEFSNQNLKLKQLKIIWNYFV